METIPEWQLILDLHEIHDELPEDAEDFIIKLKEHINEYEPLRDQLEGIPYSVDKQDTWLHALHLQHIEDDYDGAQDLWDEFYERWRTGINV